MDLLRAQGYTVDYRGEAGSGAGDLGVAQSAGNTADTCYAAVRDVAGKSVTIKHSDPAAVHAGSWQQWTIPFNSLTGVSVTQIGSLTMGVGDKTAPGHGAGRILIDDIQVGRLAQ